MIKRNDIWDLPKGKVEKAEKKRDAAIREVEEECGVSDLEIEKKLEKTYHTYIFKDKNILKTTHWYLMNYNKNEELKPQIEEGITEVKWKTIDEVKKIIPETYKNLVDILSKTLNL